MEFDTGSQSRTVMRAKIEAYRVGLKAKSGVCVFSENGPVGMSVVDLLGDMVNCCG